MTEAHVLGWNRSWDPSVAANALFIEPNRLEPTHFLLLFPSLGACCCYEEISLHHSASYVCAWSATCPASPCSRCAAVTKGRKAPSSLVPLLSRPLPGPTEMTSAAQVRRTLTLHLLDVVSAFLFHISCLLSCMIISSLWRWLPNQAEHVCYLGSFQEHFDI